MSLEIGTKLGVYDITGVLGEGGMGAVYRARDRALNRDVAVKVLLPAVSNDPDRLARFSREAQILASLSHPNLAGVYGLEESNGVRGLVMELVEGPTLAERIAGGPFAPDEALAIARQIAGALEVAHEQGIVHRDLKPANIKVKADGTVKVLDFGLAKAMEPARGSVIGNSASPTMASPGTVAGMILGTAAYMSPEQASGKEVDKRTDIWAFGVILWEMLTGRQMFQAETLPQVLAAVLTAEPDMLKVPPHVRGLLSRCLVKDPRKRLRDIGDAMNMLEQPAAQPATTKAQRWPAIAGWVLAVVLTLTLAALWWTKPTAGPVRDASLPVARFQIERPTVDPYNNTAASFAVSPDGKYLAYYVAGSDGQTGLSLQTLASGESQIVSGSAIISPSAPFWSADSRQIAFGTNVGTRVYTLSTGTTQDLCGCRFRGGTWNKDGVILLGAFGAANEPIRRLSLDSRTPVPITTIDTAKGEQDTSPQFLPDGRSFLFTRESPGHPRVTYLGTLDAKDGEAPRRIAEGSRNLFATSSDGLRSFVLGIDAAGLVAQPLDMKTMTIGGEPVVVVAGAAAASISPRGVLVTSVAGTFPMTIPMWFDRKGNARGSIGTAGALQSVNLAPDGKTVAVTETRVGNTTEIWLRNVAGGARQLTFTTPGRVNDPAWSFDAKRLVVSLTVDGIVNLFERAFDGSGEESRLFPASRNAFVNDWSQDGRWFIYTISKASNALLDLDLWVLPMGSGQERKPFQYLATSAREGQAEFSPDGNFVAYTAIEGGQPEVYVRPFPNAAGGKWIISMGGGAEPHWSRDGKKLFYIAGQTVMEVQVRLQPSFSNDPPVKLFDAPVQPWYVNDSDRSQVAANGDFLLLVSSGKNPTPPLDVLVNWAP
jgi:serine/threonine protein kinase